MSIKRKIFQFFVKILIRVFHLNSAGKIFCAISDLLEPVYRIAYKGEEYLISCPNSLIRWRADTYFTKEPETIEWIDSFKEKDVLFDIGANIGLYTIYAAKRGATVIAFEPESQNFSLLNKNVYLNRCQDKVTCLNIALSDKDCLDYLYIPSFIAGGATNCFGGTVDWNNNTFIPNFKQGVISYTMDSFLDTYKNYFPTHIKIDVDGIEPLIIKGGEKTFADKRLRTISIEINEELPEHLGIVKVIQSVGFSLTQKKHAEIFDGGQFSKCFNYLFTRNT